MTSNNRAGRKGNKRGGGERGSSADRGRRNRRDGDGDGDANGGRGVVLSRATANGDDEKRNGNKTVVGKEILEKAGADSDSDPPPGSARLNREDVGLGSDDDSRGEDDESEDGGSSSGPSVYDSADDEEEYDSDGPTPDDDEDSGDDGVEEDAGDEFEDQGSSDEDEDRLADQQAEEESDDEGVEFLGDDDDDGEGGGAVYGYENVPRRWQKGIAARAKNRLDVKSREFKKKDLGDGSSDSPAKSNDLQKNDRGKSVDDKSRMSGKGVVSADDVAKGKTVADSEALWMHTDDLSSDDDDEDGATNRIGRVPLHWYDEYDHVGYDAHGAKVLKPGAGTGTGGAPGDRLDLALKQQSDIEGGRFTVLDALHGGREIELSPRQIELIRRIQSGSFAHPEFDGNPDYVDYVSSEREISGINSDRYEPKNRFQPSKWEKLLVRRLLHRLKCGSINMDYLTGKVKDMNDVVGKRGKPKPPKDGDPTPYLLWRGDEEDELALRKGPQHIAAPKQPPPGHAESYNPPEEYLPTEEELKEWEGMDVKDRPHGLFIPKKFDSLRQVGAYEHSVRERFERCLDLYLCPRTLKRRLNIDPESLVPSLPKASDLRPFPTAKCVKYDTPFDEASGPPQIRCLSVSPDGQYLASGASDGFVRLWEVQSGRLLRSWDISSLAVTIGVPLAESEKVATESKDQNDASATAANGSENTLAKPVVSLEWNPNRSHHCLLAAVGNCTIVIATGTGGPDDAELTEALLSSAESLPKSGGNLKNARAAKAVKWIPLSKKSSASSLSGSIPKGQNDESLPISAFGGPIGPICALSTNREVASVKWHRRGDYFVTVSPKAGAAAVLIHQLSKANSQQPFRKSKGEAQCACFHPSKPFLFVASQQHIRVYHLIRQEMVKRLVSGCRWISSVDVHPAGDHIIAGSLDRRVVWFDLDLSHTPYKTLKYHEKALRSVGYHSRYPLFATSSDDGSVHVFHGMVYSDLMRNPLIVPVKVLRGHTVVKKLGVLAFTFHPTQPWLFSAGADGQIHLYQDI